MSRRTFGDLQGRDGVVLHLCAQCSFCKRNDYDRLEPEYLGARKYSTRHYICDPCIEKRRDVVLPAIRRAEAFDKRMRALGQCVDCGARGEQAGHMGCQYPGRHSG